MPSSQVSKENSHVKFSVHEVGTVKSVRECIVRVEGLPSCINGQIIEFKSGARGMVFGFNQQEAQILVFSAKGAIRVGDEVYSRAEFLHLPVGDKFLGRLVNSLCEPIDDQGPVEPADYRPVFAEAAGVMDRIPVKETLETGTLLIDAVIPIAKGQRQLLIGDRLSGKTTVAVDAIDRKSVV